MARITSIERWRPTRMVGVAPIVGPGAVFGMLFLRIGLAVGLQTLVAIALAIAGAADPWRTAADCPTTLPFLVVAHFLLDFTLPLSVLLISI